MRAVMACVTGIDGVVFEARDAEALHEPPSGRLPG
jgi:hypothetical protein